MKKMLLKTAMFIGFACFCVTSMQAQTEKTSIGVLPFTYTAGAATDQDAIAISDAVTDGFVRTKRFSIVYRSKADKIFAGLDLQKSEEYVDGSIVEEGKILGAEFLIAGNVRSAIPEAAVAKAIKNIEPMIDEFVSRNFPVTFFVVEIMETKNGEATKVLISGGTGFGLKKSDKLKIVELIDLDVDGNKFTRKKVIGEIKVTEVEDENFSQCQVTSGGIDIKNKFEAKARLRVMTLSNK